MLARKFHIPLREGLHLKGRNSRGRFFAVKESKNELPYSRFAIVIGKKNQKGAVERNKIKRFVYDWIRKSGLQEQPGKDFLIIALAPLGQIAKVEIEKDLQKIIK